MEFKFDVNDVFKGPVVEINQNLIPPGFKGDRRQLWETVNKVSEVINAMGEASASAQGLSKPITTAERLRNSDQTVYLLVDDKAHDGRGAVTGMLKTGKKGLYVFDRNGQHYQVSPPCVLDFYVHESKQRQGLGKKLFEHMLEKEKVEPVKMAIDRPSDKLLGFLNKHYGLQSPVKQMNNFVVFDEFFPNRQAKEDGDSNRAISSRTRGANGLQSSPASSSPYGRYGAPRPPCSMGQIIHNQTSVLSRASEPTGDVQPEAEDSQEEDKPKLERPSSLSLTTSEEQNELDGNDGAENGEVQNAEKDQSNEREEKAIENGIEKLSVVVNDDEIKVEKELGEEKVEIDGKTTPSDSGRKTPGLTAQGYFDLKFYHSRLW